MQHTCLAGKENSGACFSEDRTHRYSLYRKWGDSSGVAFLLLNPSIADEEKLDPTLRRCKQFAIDNGYDSMHIFNVYSLVSTDPRGLKSLNIESNHTEINWHHISNFSKDYPIILGFGTNVKKYHYDIIKKNLQQNLKQENTYALRITKDGLPSHPLYLPANLKPVIYNLELL